MYKGFEIIIEPNEEGGFYARIPDIPSIFTGGMTEIEAVKMQKLLLKNILKYAKKTDCRFLSLRAESLT